MQTAIVQVTAMQYDGMQGHNQSRFLHALYNVALVSEADAAQWKGAQEKRAPLRMDWGTDKLQNPKGVQTLSHRLLPHSLW